MTVVINETDIDIIEQLNIIVTAKCCGKKDNCPNEAEWVGTMMCCGYQFLVCDGCRVIITDISNLVGITHLVSEGGCGQNSVKMGWRPL